MFALTLSTSLVGGGVMPLILDADAQTYITQNGSITTPAQKIIVNNLVLSLKSAGLWAKFDAIYPFYGGTATANAQDLKSAYDITWAGSPTHDANGVTGDGSTAYGDTGLNWATVGGRQNDCSIYFYSRTTSPTSSAYFGGALESGSYRARVGTNVTNFSVDGINLFGNSHFLLPLPSNDFRRHFCVNRSGASDQQVYYSTGGTSFNSFSDTSTSTGVANRPFYILAANHGTAVGYSNVNLAFAAFGQSLTSEQWESFREIIDTFQAAVGRANP